MTTLTVTSALPDAELLTFVHEHVAIGDHVRIVATEPFMTPAQMADALSVSQSFVMARINAGEIASQWYGTRHLITLAEVERFRHAMVAQLVSDAADDLRGPDV